jgi:hypothetical protein
MNAVITGKEACTLSLRNKFRMHLEKQTGGGGGGGGEKKNRGCHYERNFRAEYCLAVFVAQNR